MTRSLRSASLVAYILSLNDRLGGLPEPERPLPKAFHMPPESPRPLPRGEASPIWIRDPARRAPAITHLSELLKSNGWRGTDEERDARASALLDEVPDVVLDDWAKKHATSIASAEAKRRRKGLKRLKEKK